MDNSDIFDTDLLHSQNSCDSGNSSGFISNVQIQDICFLEQSIVHNIDGVTIISGVCKHLIQTLGVFIIYKTTDLHQQTDIVVQNIGNILVVFHADLFPHNRRGGGDTCDVAETSGCDRFHIFLVTVQHADKIYQCRSDDMRKMADSGSDKIMFFTCKNHRDCSKGGNHFCKVSQFL